MCKYIDDQKSLRALVYLFLLYLLRTQYVTELGAGLVARKLHCLVSPLRNTKVMCKYTYSQDYIARPCFNNKIQNTQQLGVLHCEDLGTVTENAFGP